MKSIKNRIIVRSPKRNDKEKKIGLKFWDFTHVT